MPWQYIEEIAPCILNLGMGWRCVVSLRPWSPLSLDKLIVLAIEQSTKGARAGLNMIVNVKISDVPEIKLQSSGS
jgi:hypothetical protein